MEVRKGYKQTEEGVIPTDWNLITLDECLILLTDFEANGSFEDTANNVRVFDSENYAWYVRATDLENKSPLSKVRYVDRRSYEFLRKTMLFGGEVLITKRGEIGKVYLFEPEVKIKATLGPNLYLLKLNDKVLPKLIYYYFKYGRGNQALKTINASTTLGALYKNDVKALRLPLPPTLAEQEAIAEALSDADALIESLETLLAKKRQVKQGAMSELLSGKRRVVESGEWEVKTLADVCSYINDGTHFTPKYVDNGIPFYSVENVTADDFQNIKYISPQEHNRLIKRCKPEKGDILMTRIGALGDTKLIDWDVNASIYVSLALLKVNEQVINGKYLYCYTKSRKFKKDLEARSLVNATPQKINMAEIGGVPVLVPPLTEQTAIAEILSDMDAEIRAVEEKLSKARAVKAGMMSALLMGRIRLNRD